MQSLAPTRWFSLAPLLAVVLLLPACVAPVQVSTLDTYGRPDLTPHYDHRPVELVDRLGQPEVIETLRSARRLENVLPSVAADTYLVAAEQAYALIVDPATPAYDRALIVAELYNRAVAGYVRTSPPSLDDERVTFVSDLPGVWPDAAYFDTYTPAANINIQGLRDHHVERGLGAALVAARVNEGVEPVEALYPPEGIVRAATAVLHFDGPGKPRLVLYNPRQTDSITLRTVAPEAVPSSHSPALGGDLAFALAADYSAPYAKMLSKTEQLASLGFAGMLDPTASEERLGVYLLEPYDPDKTPLLMVHGLMSTPLTWIELTNAVRADPELRERYQVWHFLYPTAPCPYYSAYMLRQNLAETRLMLDPELDDFATQDIVVVGHSMGGILTRTLVTDSTDRAWSAAFTVPPHELEGDPEVINFMKDIYVFDHVPYVNRVVFVATPHRGSNFATNLIGQFGNSLVRLPQHCIDNTRTIARLNRDKLAPGYGPFLLNGPPSSIRTLDPDSPASRAVDENPIRDGVIYHSIIGTRVDDYPELAETSDGIVDYWSSHLDGAASETLVPAGHNAHDHPDAIVEIKRILNEHVASSAQLVRSARAQH